MPADQQARGVPVYAHAPSDLAALGVFLNPATEIAGDQPVFTPAGTVSVGRRTCARYAFREQNNAGGAGTLSVESATGQPCELHVTNIIPSLTAHGKPSTDRVTIIWGRSNDPGLIVPTVK